MIDATLSSFERDVIDASMEVPVLVDFWAPWCGPCKQLGPLLERLEREYGGRFKLVNVNSDTNPELVSSFNLQSIPHSVAFVDGNAVAQFAGAQPEAFVRAFLDRLIPDPSEIEHRAAREALAKGQPEVAESYLKNAIALDPANDAARLDMAAILLERGDVHPARTHFDALSSSAPQLSTYSVVSTRLEAAELAEALPPAETLTRRIRVDPADLEARLELAELHIARREFEPALEQLLEIVGRDRSYRDDGARLKMLAVFDMAADEPDLVTEYRGRLSRLLF
ncbi:MAG TPA: tetratricopeptide repeat protein [Usitatibacter sp.]|nr:tetratricopeptide repeat protein [Usitatibacter sp.]